MKRQIFALCAGALLLTGCNRQPMAQEQAQEGGSFLATVVEVQQGSLLVEPLAGESIRDSADRVVVPLNEQEPAADWQVGDGVQVEFASGVMESYPAQLSGSVTLTPLPEIDAPAAEPLEGVSMAVLPGSVKAGGLTLVLESSYAGQCLYGEEFRLECWQEESWQPLPRTPGTGWNDIGYILEQGQSRQMDVDWVWAYGNLAPGRYRMGKTLMDFRATADYDSHQYYVDFTLQ